MDLTPSGAYRTPTNSQTVTDSGRMSRSTSQSRSQPPGGPPTHATISRSSSTEPGAPLSATPSLTRQLAWVADEDKGRQVQALTQPLPPLPCTQPPPAYQDVRLTALPDEGVVRPARPSLCQRGCSTGVVCGSVLTAVLTLVTGLLTWQALEAGDSPSGEMAERQAGNLAVYGGATAALSFFVTLWLFLRNAQRRIQDAPE